MMKIKEKAEYIYNKYCDIIEINVNPYWDEQKANKSMDEFHSKVLECALISVNEIIDTIKDVNSNEIELDIEYWNLVKIELLSYKTKN